jgi:hypothetical protein
VTSAQLPVGKPGEWSYEPKFDGFRCLAFRCGERVRLQSRQQRSLTRYFCCPPFKMPTMAPFKMTTIIGQLGRSLSSRWRRGCHGAVVRASAGGFGVVTVAPGCGRARTRQER